jgi:hypothetical protein
MLHIPTFIELLDNKCWVHFQSILMASDSHFSSEKLSELLLLDQTRLSEFFDFWENLGGSYQMIDSKSVQLLYPASLKDILMKPSLWGEILSIYSANTDELLKYFSFEISYYFVQRWQKKLNELNDQYILNLKKQGHEIYRLHQCESLENSSNQKVLNIIEKQIWIKNITNKKMKKIDILPRKLVVMDGHLQVIYETYPLHQLGHLQLENFIDFQELKINRQPFYSRLDVQNYIQGWRIVNGTEARMIIKIEDQAKYQDLPHYHYLHHIAKVPTPMGKSIMSANIEISQVLLEDLKKNQHCIEILGPNHLVKEFDKYCSKTTKKTA